MQKLSVEQAFIIKNCDLGFHMANPPRLSRLISAFLLTEIE